MVLAVIGACWVPDAVLSTCTLLSPSGPRRWPYHGHAHCTDEKTEAPGC